MGEYVLKIKKGTKMQSGRHSTGGCLRSAGNRVKIFNSRKQANTAKKIIVNRWAKNKQIPKGTKKRFLNRIVVKKI